MFRAQYCHSVWPVEYDGDKCQALSCWSRLSGCYLSTLHCAFLASFWFLLCHMIWRKRCLLSINYKCCQYTSNLQQWNAYNWWKNCSKKKRVPLSLGDWSINNLHITGYTTDMPYIMLHKYDHLPLKCTLWLNIPKNPEIIYGNNFSSQLDIHLLSPQVWQYIKANPFPNPYWKQQEHYVTISSTQTNVLFISHN